MELTREQWIDAAMNPGLDEFNEDLEDDDDFEFVDHFFDCGMTTDGNCTKIGSEECDWECPHSHLLMPSTPTTADQDMSKCEWS